MKWQLRATLLSALALSACNPTTEPGQAPLPIPDKTVTNSETTTWVSRHSQAVCDSTAELHQALTGFLDTPTADTLGTSQQIWTQAHNHYRLLATGYRLAGLLPPHVTDDRDTVDGWPLIPGYLDQVPGYPHSGLVYSEVPLTPDFLTTEHQSTDFGYLTLGFHPLEFMLWGNPGESLEDQAQKFVGGAEDPDTMDIPGRRRDLTRLISNLLKRSTEPLCAAAEQSRLSAALTSAHSPGGLPDDLSLAPHEPPVTGESSGVAESEEPGQ